MGNVNYKEESSMKHINLLRTVKSSVRFYYVSNVITIFFAILLLINPEFIQAQTNNNIPHLRKQGTARQRIANGADKTW